MPLYEYECEACRHRFEVIQKYSDPPVGACPACGGVVRKLLSSPAIQFKGSGWYITDYARKGADAEKSRKDGKETSAGSATESGAASPDSAAPKTTAPAPSPAPAPGSSS